MCFLQIESLSVTFHGHDLIVDSELELNYGRFAYDYYWHKIILFPYTFLWLSLIFTIYFSDVMVCLD